MKIFIACIALFGSILLTECNNQNNKIKRVVLDVSGGIDDAYALIIFLNADRQGVIKIEGIVCSIGDTDIELSCRNTLMLLETAGRLDIPVYKGAAQPLMRNFEKENFYGKDAFGDLIYKKMPDTSLLKKTLPLEALRDLVQKYPNEITMILVGVLTNAALPIRHFQQYPLKIKEVFILGGNYDHTNKGRFYKPTTEYYFGIDPEAAEIIFSHAQWNITVVPDEVSLDVKTTYGWRWDNIVGNNPVCNLLNKADKSAHSTTSRNEVWVSYDPLIIMPFLYPEQTTFRFNDVAVELCDEETRGQLLIKSYDCGKVRIVTGFNEEFFNNIMVNACKNVCSGGNKYNCSNKYLL